MRGDESLGTLLNLVGWFDMARTSALQWARANDDELAKNRLRRQRETGQKPPTARKPSVETFEYSPELEMLSQIYEIEQQVIHAVHTHQTKAARRKAKITRAPVPRTATSRARKALAKEAFRRMESLLVFSDEPYGPDSTLVRHSKLPPSAGYAAAKQKKAPPGAGARAGRPNRLNSPS